MVSLDGEHLGRTPLSIHHVPVGGHRLLITMDGYRDYSKEVEIKPGTDHRIEDVQLSRIRNWWWWTSRVGGPAAALFAVGVLTGGGGEAGSEEDALPKPPDPPGY
jgi:hypothetical protein